MDADPPRASSSHDSVSSWVAEKARWRDVVLRCPWLGDHRVVPARDAVASLTSAMALYVFLHLMVRDDGIPYYFIWLTNWTGMVTAVYAVLHAWATRRAARLRDDQDAGDATEIPRGVHALWALKCIAPVAQLLITTVYWGVLWRPQYGPVSAYNVVAHGVLYSVTLVDFVALNRFTIDSRTDLANAYAYGGIYVCFNLVYTFIPGATTTQGRSVHLPSHGLARQAGRLGGVHRRGFSDRVTCLLVRHGLADADAGQAVVPSQGHRGHGDCG